MRPLFDRKAFTILETLIALTVVGILCALLYPFMIDVKGRAIAAGCMSNQRDLGLAIFSYASENSYYLPPAMVGSSAAWRGRIQPYVRSPEVFLCKGHIPTTPSNLSYAYNMAFGNLDASGNRKASLDTSGASVYKLHNLLRFINPSETTMLMDIAHAPGAPNYGGGNGHVFYYDGRIPLESYRHNGAVNVLWVDGHVSQVTPDVVTSWSGGPQWKARDNYQ